MNARIAALVPLVAGLLATMPAAQSTAQSGDVTAPCRSTVQGEVQLSILEVEVGELPRPWKGDRRPGGAQPLRPFTRAWSQPGWHVLLGELGPVDHLLIAIECHWTE